jgi:Flp pilus assembly protein TadD
MLPSPMLSRAAGRKTIRIRQRTQARPHSTRVRGIATVALLALALGGCETNGTLPFAAELSAPAPPPTATLQEQDDVKYFPSDEPLHLANEHFDRGNYGLAERYYRDAVEKAPRDVTAWIGLAASYDRIGRFDLADRAYASAIKLNGETIELLNNEGYSYMLRGDLVRARKKLLKAYQYDPNNPTILNNLKLLDGSSNIIRRNANP